MSPKSGSDGEYIHPQQHESNSEKAIGPTEHVNPRHISARLQVYMVIPNGVRNLSEVWKARQRGIPRHAACLGMTGLAFCCKNFLFLSFYSVNEQRARFAKRAKLRGVFEPAARVGFRHGRGVGNAAMRDIREARILK